MNNKLVRLSDFCLETSNKIDGTEIVSLRGNATLFSIQPERFLAVFCSNKTPPSILLQLHDLANQWRYCEPIIISGFQSQGENEVLSFLLRGPQPVIICMAREIKKMRIKPEWKIPFEENRLLLVSPFEENIKRPTAKTAYQRNLVAAGLADKVLIAHAQPGSKTEKLAKEILEWDKPIFTLKNKYNQNLVDMGIEELEEF